jgi:hypothetical protein
MRAQQLADAGSMPRRLADDKYVKKAYRFLMRLRRNDPKTEVRLESEHPELFYAFKIYETTHTPMRWLLEAGILADQTATDMAEYLNTSKKVVETYEKMFFDVRDALGNTGCIISNVLGHAIMGGRLPMIPDVLWKALAYGGGWGAVQAVVEHGYIPPAVMDFYRQHFMNRTIINGSLSASSVRFNDHNAADHSRLALDLIRQEEELGSAKTGDMAHMAMGGLLKSIKLSVLPAKQMQLAEEPRLQHISLPSPKVVDVEVEEGKKK